MHILLKFCLFFIEKIDISKNPTFLQQKYLQILLICNDSNQNFSKILYSQILYNIQYILYFKSSIIFMQEITRDTRNNVCIIVIGMAGSGKTTFVSKYVEAYQKFKHIYSINLDPAVKFIPFKPIIDIRETHQYRKIMKDYELGPNGAILTALNLFTSQPERIINKMQQMLKINQQDNVFIIDIPGQIEAFTWSASSMILTKSIGIIMPVVLFYIVDSYRCQNPNSYLSNLLFAESIQCRLNYPIVICLNKSDIVDCTNCIKWTKDYDQFSKALDQTSNYLSTLSKSVVLYMSEFFQKFKLLMISSKTGQGFQLIQGVLRQNIKQYIKQKEEENEKQIKKSEKQVQKQMQNLKLKEKKVEPPLLTTVFKVGPK